jgi:NADPH:quinone reductase-like Zn-dependent oxidoreductase
MHAIVISKPGGPEVLQYTEVADVTPQRNEIRVRVRATAVNRADLVQRSIQRLQACPRISRG